MTHKFAALVSKLQCSNYEYTVLKRVNSLRCGWVCAFFYFQYWNRRWLIKCITNETFTGTIIGTTYMKYYQYCVKYLKRMSCSAAFYFIQGGLHRF